MLSRIRAVRPRMLLTAMGAATLLALAAAPATSAATIYTCVSKKGGAMRIVSAKTKCKHGESKLSWSSSGSAGPAGGPGATGATGAAGKQGASGDGIDYATSKLGKESVALAKGGEDLVLSKTLPAGSYLVTAQTTLVVSEVKTSMLEVLACGLADSTGTPAFVEPAGQALDESVWLQTLMSISSGVFGASTDVALQTQLTTSAPTTLALICEPIEGASEGVTEAFDSQLSALQTTAND
jgi:hypothetical protein